ncbi:hypothetical protein ACFSZS_02220 [Seohaeicola zhoushanensis]
MSETEALSIPVPVQVAGVLNRSAQVCGKLPDEYAIDCLIVHLRQAISVTPRAANIPMSTRSSATPCASSTRSLPRTSTTAWTGFV